MRQRSPNYVFFLVNDDLGFALGGSRAVPKSRLRELPVAVERKPVDYEHLLSVVDVVGPFNWNGTNADGHKWRTRLVDWSLLTERNLHPYR